MSVTPEEISTMTGLIRDGKKEGFSWLYANYASALYGILYRMTGDKGRAENLLEATFVCICNRIHEYTGEQRFFTWMIQITQELCNEQVSKEGRPPCKDAMEMIFFGGLSYDETAGQLKVSAAAVKSGLRTQLKALR